MSWCQCFDSEEAELAYQKDKMKMTHLASTASPSPPPPLLSHSQSQIHFSSQIQAAKKRNRELRFELGQKRKRLWERADYLERRSEQLRANYSTQQSHLSLLVAQIDKRFP